MTTSLRNTIEELAEAFAKGVLDAIRRASLDDILSETSGAPGRQPTAAPGRPRVGTAPRGSHAGGRLGRRSKDQIRGLVDEIVSLLEKHPDGLRAEEIRDKLGVQSKELPRPLQDATRAGLVGKAGRKRATTYFAKKGKGKPTPKATKAAPKGGKRAAAKKNDGARRGGRRGKGRGGAESGGAAANSES